MKKKYRIKKSGEFQEVFQRGKSFANRQFIIYKLEKENQDHFRIGISVSKKIGKAVTRNRVKRLVREVFKELKNELPPNADFVIIARKPAADMKYGEVKKSLLHILKIAKVLNRNNIGEKN